MGGGVGDRRLEWRYRDSQGGWRGRWGYRDSQGGW